MERIDDLQCHGYRIIQNPDWFCFGMDAVLLSEYARSFVNASTPVMDLCTGSGVIPLLLAGKRMLWSFMVWRFSLKFQIWQDDLSR